MTLNLTIPQQTHTDFTPRITVIGVGGGGTNAVDNMIALDLQGVEFVVANTDAQQLMNSRSNRRVQLGPHITQGLGAGAKPEIGRAAAEEAAEELYRHLDGAHMVFITAGMGGGTGTGAAPVIARMARERNILTVGVVTKPFTFEGVRRARAAEQGIEELQQYVDTLIVIPNQNLFRIANEKTTWKDAFKMADHVLYMGVRGVTDLMMTPGQVNLDFADIRTVMAEMGKAMMGTGEADGENRAVRAAEAAISNPLLDDTNMAGARGLLINITGGDDMTLFEVDQAANRIREEVDEEANIIFGSAIDTTLSGRIRVSVVATGIDASARAEAQKPRLVSMGGVQAQGAGHQSSPMLAPHSAPGAPVLAGSFGNTATARAMALPQPSHAQPSHTQPSHAQPQTSYQPQPTSYQSPYHPQPQHASPLRAPQPVEEPAISPQHAMDHADAGPAVSPQRLSRSAGLFAPEPVPPALPESPRRNIFQAVTGRLRSSLGGAAPASAQPGAAQEPVLQTAELSRASVRQAESSEMPLEIPAFLRRQSS